ncbi:MORN repeat-containing protein 4 homolog [Anthonomus grandis grandis]|uniref:MORN repeat-containing protein 4 homolog n=1 Tax=Anthonomus grandis grandis TaxID=2921223 RepID=UPI002165FB63|nr:MORN repeat-containing protein 4 homolog [Anthonomus grandis grandis]
MTQETTLPLNATGGFRFKNGSTYVGSWNNKGTMQGDGHLLLPGGIRYDGCFDEGLFHGLGVLTFPDGARYEGEFFQGWFHGYGVFWRADGTRHEGEFRGGKIWGLGLTTFNDDTHGFPRNEGYFQECQLKRRRGCSDTVQKAQKVAFTARTKFLCA